MDNVNKLVVGVLGGMGSYSTLHFFESLIHAFPVEKEWERPRVIIDNHCVLPSRVRAILYGERREELVRGMAESLRGLLAYNPDVIAIPCHTAHCFLREVRALLEGRDDRVLDMIGVVADHCRAEDADEVFLLATEGTIATKVYEQYCAARGVEVHTPDEGQKAATRAYIEQVKMRRGLDARGFRRFVGGLGDMPVILGCTELSVLYDAGEGEPKVPVIDPIALMVSRIHAMSDAKSTGAPLGLGTR